MYAVISAGGKQYRVAEGQTLDIELVDTDEGSELELRPVLVVDGDAVLSSPADLAAARVTAEVVGQAKGPKVTGFTYKPKSNQRRRYGHRQQYSTVTIRSITKG
jgi:large subunit ribosomal protein L21